MDKRPDTDLHALKNGFVSVVPTQYDLTAYAVIEKYKDVDAFELVKRLHEPSSPWYKTYNKGGQARGINQPLDDYDIIERSTPVIKEFFREKIKNQ